MDVNRENPECRVCGNRDDNTPWLVKEMMFGTGEEFPYFECSGCGCLQIETVPDDIGRYYRTGYYSLSGSPGDKFNSPLKRLVRRIRDSYTVLGERRVAGRTLRAAFPSNQLPYLGKGSVSRRSRVLDVGCGSGWLLWCLKNLGFSSLTGVDPFIDSDIRYPGGPVVLKRPLLELDGEWDIIIFNHSFEHLPDPGAILGEVRRLLVPGGLVVIVIPTTTSYAWRHYRTDWVQLDAPRHLFLHSLRSMEMLAHNAGFRVDDVVYNSSELQFWGSEQYRRGIAFESESSYHRGLSGSIFTSREIRAFRRRARELDIKGEGDTVAFYLTGRGDAVTGGPGGPAS